MEDATKQCPYCGETIQAVAIKCKYCGEWLAEKTYVQPSARPLAAATVATPAPPPAAEVPPAAPTTLVDDEDDAVYITKNVKILMVVEFVIGLAILFITFDETFHKISLRNVFTAVLIGYQIFNNKTSRTGACISLSILWALIGLGPDLDWGIAILFFLLSCAINYGIITVIMKKDGIRFKNAL